MRDPAQAAGRTHNIEDGTMDHSPIQSAIPAHSQPSVLKSGECIYQFAIILAALLMIVTASLF
jgi:hypothetical protein